MLDEMILASSRIVSTMTSIMPLACDRAPRARAKGQGLADQPRNDARAAHDADCGHHGGNAEHLEERRRSEINRGAHAGQGEEEWHQQHARQHLQAIKQRFGEMRGDDGAGYEGADHIVQAHRLRGEGGCNGQAAHDGQRALVYHAIAHARRDHTG